MNISSWLLLLSRGLERFSYYGIISAIVLYMVTGPLALPQETALNVYTWLGLAVVFSYLVGVLLSDLLIGNKVATIMGGLLLAAGCFVLGIASNAGLYTGLCLIVVGSGFYTPNIIARFGKSFYGSPRYLPMGYTLFYIILNIGAFTATSFFAEFSEAGN